MPSERILTLQATADGSRRSLQAERRLCVGPPGNVFLFGGVGMGAALTALEDATGRPVIWATAQFLGAVRPDEVLDIAVETPVASRAVSQARAIGRTAGGEVFTVLAALGSRESPVSRQWSEAPDVPAAEACAPPTFWPHGQSPGTLTERILMRCPPGPLGESPPTGEISQTGRRAFWLRLTDDAAIDVATLAVFADFVPYALAAALGGGLGGTSLDNTLRVLSVRPTRWVLCDARIAATHAGFAHGEIRLFAEDGQLMAIGSQSNNVWLPKPKP